MTQNLNHSVPGTPSVPIADENGNVTLPWYSFFVSMWNRTGGSSGTVSAILDGITNVAGSIIYRGAQSWQGLGPGSANKLLRMGAAFPSWELINGSSFSDQLKNEFLAAPAGANGTPVFRVIETPDLDALAGQYPGTTSGDDASAGNIGEFVSSQVASGAAVNLTTTVAADVTTIILTAGDWDVWGSIGTTAAPTTANGWISITSATDPGPPNSGAYLQWTTALFQPLGMTRVSLAATTTLYLSAKATFAGTNKAFGFIGARRRR